MSKKPLPKNPVSLTEFFGFLFSFFYLNSVLTVAHHTSMWRHDGSSHIVEKPAVPLLVLALILILYTSRKDGWFKFSTLSVISLTILATSSVFWISGLRANFFF